MSSDSCLQLPGAALFQLLCFPCSISLSCPGFFFFFFFFGLAEPSALSTYHFITNCSHVLRAYLVPGTDQWPVLIILIFTTTLWGKNYNYAHFTDEETEAWKDEVACTKTQSAIGETRSHLTGLLHFKHYSGPLYQSP